MPPTKKTKVKKESISQPQTLAEPKPPSLSFTQQEIDLMIVEAKKEAEVQSHQALYKSLVSFLSQRMHQHFESRNDEIAKELRTIIEALQKNIQS